MVAGVELERLAAVDAGDDAVGVIERGFHARDKVLGTKQVGDADAAAGHLIDEAGADAFARCTDGLFAARGFIEPIEGDVPGHDELGAVAKDQL